MLSLHVKQFTYKNKINLNVLFCVLMHLRENAAHDKNKIDTYIDEITLVDVTCSR